MNYVIAGGGTGGHIYPAVALAERLQSHGNVIMLARSGSREEEVFASRGLQVVAVSSAPLLYSPRSLWHLLQATISGVTAARRIMKANHVDAFIGTGGYVSAPGIVAALMSGIPVYLLEQNTVMGRANRLFARRVRHVFLGFPIDGLSGPRYLVTGNPLRQELYAVLKGCRSSSSLRSGLLFLGGSGGALFINDLFLRTIRELDKRGVSLDVTVVTGTDDNARIRSEVGRLKLQHVRPSVIAYEEHMGRIYCKTRVAVTRGGALALTELAVAGIYAIMIPYPFAVAHHQSKNAVFLEQQNLGILIEQDSIDFDAFVRTVERALGEASEIQLPAGSIFAQDAGDLITQSIMQEIHRG